MISLFSVAIVALTIYTAPLTQAEDLPIDITAIGRQEAREGQPTTRIATNLFSEDSQWVNEALAHQISQRQAAATHLFLETTENQEIDIYTRIIAAAYSSNLFTQPVTINTFTVPQQTAAPIPIWMAVPIIFTCAAAGFVWALASANKKRKKKSNVH